MYLRVEQLVLKAATTGGVLDYNLSETYKHFDQDFDNSRLKNQLAVLHNFIHHVNPTFQDIHKAIKFVFEVLKLLQTLYVIPATAAIQLNVPFPLLMSKNLFEKYNDNTAAKSHDDFACTQTHE